MKKVGIILSIIGIVVASYLFVTESYYFYPSLPVDNLSARYVVEKLENSDAKVAQIAEEDNYTWYITENRKDKDISSSDENIKEHISSNDWRFKEKIGSTLFFEKENENLVVSTQMWTEKYTLVQVPNKYNN